MTLSPLRTDCVIIGGGIAGLWARAVMARAGFGVVLVSDGALGAGQTVASQGILHRGVKYLMSPGAAAAAGQLAAAHGSWDEALRGDGPVDLRAVGVLSACTYLWTAPGLLAGITGAAASLAMRSEVRRLARGELPACFVPAPERTAVWRVEEPCLDARSLVSTLAAIPAGPILTAAASGVTVVGDGVRVAMPGVMIEARAALFTAGAGNEALLRGAGVDPGPITQRRPLRMTLVRGAPFLLFGHCVRELSDKPRLTITSAEHGGRTVWYVGGDVAERGVDLDGEAHLARVRKEVAACLPWADLSRAEFAQFTIDRAESRGEGGKRPDTHVLRDFGRFAALWPTKLALAPVAAGDALAWLRGAIGESRDRPGAATPPPTAPAPWERTDLAWT